MSAKHFVKICIFTAALAALIGGLAYAQPWPPGRPANQFAVARQIVSYGSTMPKNFAAPHWSGYYGWNGHPLYIWNEYSSDYSYYPYDRSYSYTHAYDYYHPYDAEYYRRNRAGLALGATSSAKEKP